MAKAAIAKEKLDGRSAFSGWVPVDQKPLMVEIKLREFLEIVIEL